MARQPSAVGAEASTETIMHRRAFLSTSLQRFLQGAGAAGAVRTATELTERTRERRSVRW